MTQVSIVAGGPAPSGKSIVAKILARELGYIYTDTGTMYRAATYLATTNNVSFSDEERLVSLVKKYLISFSQQEGGQHAFIASRDVTLEIHQPGVTKAVSEVSAYGKAREELTAIQRRTGERGDVAMGGRDVGIAILPNVEVKIFLVVNVSERTERCFKRNQEGGTPIDLEILTKEIQERDHHDSTRDVSPLKQAEDTVRINMTGESIPEVVIAMKAVVLEKGYSLF